MTWKESIEWGRPWNPITGCGRIPGCTYCYARRFAKRLAGRFGYPKDEPFRPTFHPDRLEVPLRRKKPTLWFVGSMAEIFGPGVPDGWIADVLGIVERAPQHKFLFPTKCPARMAKWTFPPNAWCGISAEDHGTLSSRAPDLMKVKGPEVRFYSIEPLLGWIRGMTCVDWGIIGAQTGPGASHPTDDQIHQALLVAKGCGSAVFMKDNLKPYYTGELLKEMPFEARRVGPDNEERR